MTLGSTPLSHLQIPILQTPRLLFMMPPQEQFLGHVGTNASLEMETWLKTRTRNWHTIKPVIQRIQRFTCNGFGSQTRLLIQQHSWLVPLVEISVMAKACIRMMEA